VDSVLIVTGHENNQVEGVLSGYLTDRVQSVFNSQYRLGRSESIKCAVRHFGEEADAALFMVADKPGVTSALIDRAIERYRQVRPPILYIETPAGRGHPIIYSKSLFGELLLMEGDRVGNALVAKYKDAAVALNDECEQTDIDDESDYHTLLKEQSAGRDTTSGDVGRRNRPHRD
jgi:molybdenum cofactor cytidylyltransferase